MNRIIIIGAGAVGRTVAYKCAQNTATFSDIWLVSKTKSKCDKIASDIKKDLNINISTHQVDADKVSDLVELINKINPKMIIHVALPYQDLSIMDACIATKVHYLDTANYEPREEAKFEYKWQWDYQNKFKKAGITAVLGCGFDPGVTNIFTAYAAKHYFDKMHYLDIVDCNGGDHGKAFATNFNPEINIREVIQKGKYYENQKWIEVAPHSIEKELHYPNIGKRSSYLIYHEELESLVKNFPSLKRARFWMTFSKEYLTHLRVIQNIGMANIQPIQYEGKNIVPLQFLKAILPNPLSLGEKYQGETSIGCRIKGIKGNKEKSYYIYNNCKHQDAFHKVGVQAIAYTTGVPAMIGAMMVLTGKWTGSGVFNVEEFNPDPFMKELNEHGLEWKEKHNIDLELN